MKNALKLYEDIMEILAIAMDNKIITDNQMIYLAQEITEAKDNLKSEN